MAIRLKKLKPGVDQRVHLLLAAMLWTGIGAWLLYRGTLLLAGDNFLIYAALGIAGGTMKSLLVLDGVSRRGIERIKTFADNTCIGAVYSWKTWLLVFSMASLGMLFRRFDMAVIRGTICAGIGWALVFSSRLAWKSWQNWNDNAKTKNDLFSK